MIGLDAGTYGGAVAAYALRFVGLRYLQSEELTSDGIDCSTLTSQSHWAGALEVIPFRAEAQRTAEYAFVVRDTADALPGDVFVQHQDSASSPGGRHNHVGMMVGWVGGEPTLLEASERVGVRIINARSFELNGGIRRFLADPCGLMPRTAVARAALAMAGGVPKFGRFGMRQYLGSACNRVPHRATDIYVASGSKVYAPFDGRAEHAVIDPDGAQGVRVIANGRTCELGHVEPTALGSVRRGQVVGRVLCPAPLVDILYSPAYSDPTHLHFAVGCSARPSVRAIHCDGLWWSEPLAMCREGIIGVPVDQESVRGAFADEFA